MIALDTNVLVRFLVQDEPREGALATELVALCSRMKKGFICREVLVELVWVLEDAYRFERAKIAEALDGLLAAEEFMVEAADTLAVVVNDYRHGQGHFSDLMIAAAAQRTGCTALYTFDTWAARHSRITVLAD